MDLRSLGFAQSLTLVLLYAMLALVVWRIGEHPAYRALKNGAICAAVGLALNATQGLAPPTIPFAIGNALVVMGSGWIYLGIRRLSGEDPSPLWVYGAGVLMFASGYLWGALQPNLGGRLTTTSALVMVFGLATARALLFDRRLRPLGATALVLGWMQVITVAILGARIGCYWIYGIPSQNIMEQHPLNAALYFSLLLSYTAFAMGLNLLVVTRLTHQLYELATRDALTGALNRAGLQRELLQTERDFSGLLLMDLDHFKRVNDVHGHDVGDRLLQRFTEIVHAEIGERDMLVRMGGEEFLLLVVDANPKVVAERIRRAFADKSLGLGATVSIGVVNLDRQRRLDLRADLKAADEALYMAKRSGRDRVQMAELA